jgi:microcystin-dependent protein
VPIGVVLPHSLSTLPSSKWLFPAGQALNRADYPDLWTAAQAEIAAGNTDWTAGNGTTTFTIPDLSGYALVGRDVSGSGRVTTAGSGIDGTKLGAHGGGQSVTLTLAQTPSHTISGVTGTENQQHNHNFGAQLGGNGGYADGSGGGGYSSTGTTGTENQQHNHNFSASNGGGDQPHTNRQPSKVVNFIMRALP